MGLFNLRSIAGRGSGGKCAIAAVAKNEGAILAEWIAFHFEAGFSTVIVYDNLSSDQTPNIVKQASKRVDVRRVIWPSTSVSYQSDAYDDCVLRFGADFDWIAFIDLDEFVVAPGGRPIAEVLLGAGNAAAVAINWQIYGSSNHIARSPGLVTETFLYRARADFGANKHVKSFVRPDSYIKCINPHFMSVIGEYSDICGNPIEWEMPGVSKRVNHPEVLRINHYFTRSRADWKAKRQRGHRGAERSSAEFNLYDRNEVYDDAATPFAARARSRSFVHAKRPGPLPRVASALPENFNPEIYLRLHPDVAQSGYDPTDHYLECGRFEGRAIR